MKKKSVMARGGMGTMKKPLMAKGGSKTKKGKKKSIKKGKKRG